MKYYVILISLFCICCQEQRSTAIPTQPPAADKPPVPYGNNAAVGKYVNVGDVNLYYEIYGTGKPIVLLHGGVFGGIDEFAQLIESLSKNYEVICIATRGHGKSGVGDAAVPVTWEQRSNDAYTVIRSITKDSVMVLGFSDGAQTGYKLAANHPDAVKKLIAIGGGDRPKGRQVESSTYTPELLLTQMKDYFEPRLKAMPEPDRWGETLTKLNFLYDKDYLSTETYEKITCPVLIMAGDQDGNNNVDKVAVAFKSIPGSQLSIIPGCGHVVLSCNYPAVWESIAPFIQ